MEIGKKIEWVMSIVAASVLLTGCGSFGTPMGVAFKTRTQFEVEWAHFLEFESDKALAIAGDIGSRFVLGYSFGYLTEDLAIEAAMEACELRRADRRIEDECTLYAVDDQLVAPADADRGSN
jgi:hypothetical protein